MSTSTRGRGTARSSGTQPCHAQCSIGRGWWLSVSETGTAWCSVVQGTAMFRALGCACWLVARLLFPGSQPLFVESINHQGWLDCLQFVILYLPRREIWSSARHLPMPGNQMPGVVIRKIRFLALSRFGGWKKNSTTCCWIISMFCATHHSFVTLRGRSNVNVHMKHLWHVVDKLELFYRKKKGNGTILCRLVRSPLKLTLSVRSYLKYSKNIESVYWYEERLQQTL